MNIDDFNTIHTLYRLAKESKKSNEYVDGLVYEKIQKLKKELLDTKELLKQYEMLEKEIKEMEIKNGKNYENKIERVSK